MSNNINCIENKNQTQLSAETIQMIEEKRRLAIKRRNQKSLSQTTHQSFTNNSINSTNNRSAVGSSFWTTRNSQSMTNIKPTNRKGNETSLKCESKSEISPYSRPNVSEKQKIVKQELMASIRLLSSKRFEIGMGYNSEVVTILRKCESKDFDPISKKWSFDIKDYKKLINELLSIPSVNIKITDSIPDSVMVALSKSRLNKNNVMIDLKERLSSELVDELFPFQREGVLFGIEHSGRCLIADDMGLGKTIQAICLAQWFSHDWPLIIICPSSLRYQWLNSLNRWLPHISKNDILIVKKTNEHLPQIPITIISYDLLARMRSQFSIESKMIYNMVILDESHYIKSDSALRTETVQLLAKSSKRVVLLTGTPALSRPMELFPQINVIDPKLFASKHAFGMRYCDAQQKMFWVKGARKQMVWDYKGAKNLDELRILLEETILIRRLKKDVLEQLPRKRREMVILSVDHLSQKQQKKLLSFQTIAKKLYKKTDHTCLFEWYGESALAKVQPVSEYLEQLIEKDIKFLCFCHHKQMMDGIEDMLAKKQVNHIRIDGSTPPKARQEACDEFQAKDDCRVAILSITACATGLNLTSASTVVFAETYWNPGVLSQAEDRVHRIGQQENVRIIYLVAKTTIDDLIWPMISKKLDVLNKAGLSKDNFSEATNALDAIKSDQQLITEFLQSFDKDELKALLEDDIEIL